MEVGQVLIYLGLPEVDLTIVILNIMICHGLWDSGKPGYIIFFGRFWPVYDQCEMCIVVWRKTSGHMDSCDKIFNVTELDWSDVGFFLILKNFLTQKLRSVTLRNDRRPRFFFVTILAADRLFWVTFKIGQNTKCVVISPIYKKDILISTFQTDKS